MSTTTLEQFVEQCEALLAAHGQTKAQFVNGTLRRDATVYEMPGLNVAKYGDKELEISIEYFRSESGKPLSNPVYCRDADGKVYRTHGEWSYAIERVRRLTAGETPDQPIQLGKGTRGWTEGLD
jgi:hypothetical protein